MKCLFCGSEDLSLAANFECTLSNNSIVGGGYSEIIDIYMCNNCGYGFYNNTLTIDGLKDFYEVYDCTLPFNNLSVSDWFARHINLVSKYKPKDAFIVEIGSSEGYFLHLLNENGYKNNLGIEPSKHALNGIARGLNIKKLFFTEDTIEQEKLFEKKSVDAFVLLHTFEHFADPFVIFKTMVDYLKDDGLIFIETPNFSSFGYGHLSYFSWPFYEKMAHRYNMKIIDIMDGRERIAVVFAHENSDYKEIKCPYKVIDTLNRVKDRDLKRHQFFMKVISEIKYTINISNNVLLWGTKKLAEDIIQEISDIDDKCSIIPVDSYPKRRGIVLDNIKQPVVCPEDIKGRFFDAVIVTTEFIDEVVKTMKLYDISYLKIINACYM